ncbi:MAG: VOC family protein [Ignavibacteria bacterium]|nr:VOC family protein [Ignavibacteria bacterium]
MKFGHIEIFVKDPLKIKEFYEKILGFEIVAVQQEKFVWMKLGENEILLRPGKNNLKAKEYEDSNTGFVLYTSDLVKTKNELAGRGLEFRGTDGSENCLTFTDPEGNWFQLVNPEHS